MASLIIREFTDPACPFAFSAEPMRIRLRWLFGDQIEWQPRMVALAESAADYEAKGFDTKRQVTALETIQSRYGMPIDTRERPRMMATVHACRAVVAARLHAPEHERALLRRLRIRAMAGDLIDEPAVIAAAASEAGVEPMKLLRAIEDDPAVEVTLREDMVAARAPSAPALALDDKLADDALLGRRYTCPSYEIERAGGDGWPRFDAPGFQPFEVYEAGIANLAPEIERNPKPGSVQEVLEWAGEPLASAEVAAVCELSIEEARAQLAEVANENAVGADGWWSLQAAEPRLAA